MTFDETRVSRVSTEVDGWVEKVFVDFTGAGSSRASRCLRSTAPRCWPRSRIPAGSEVERDPEEQPAGHGAAAGRLAVRGRAAAAGALGSERRPDRRVARTGKPIRNVTIYSPIERLHHRAQGVSEPADHAGDGALHDRGPLPRLGHGRRLRDDAARIRLGQAATVTLTNAPGRPDPRPGGLHPAAGGSDDAHAEGAARRAESRHALKPDMYVDVEFRFSDAARADGAGRGRAGHRRAETVFVDRGNGFLEPRQVETGERIGDRVEILSGLKAGERIVTSGNFLIDSESQLKPRELRNEARMIDRIIEFSARNKRSCSCWSGSRWPPDGGRCRRCRSTPFPTSATRRSSSTRAGTAAPTSSRTRSPIPIVTAMLGAPKVKAVRGFSDFGYSYVYIIFEEGTDIYWARSRTLEYLSGVLPRLPQGVRHGARARCDRRRLGVPVRAGRHDAASSSLAELRSLSGLVSALLPEVGAGRRRSGAARRLRAAVPGARSIRTGCGRSTSRSARWSRPCARATTTSAGGWSRFSGAEYMVRGRGYAKSTDDIGNIVLARSDERRRRCASGTSAT